VGDVLRHAALGRGVDRRLPARPGRLDEHGRRLHLRPRVDVEADAVLRPRVAGDDLVAVGLGGPGRARVAVDRDDGTTWSTESYQDGLEGAGKTGVGIYIDAKPKVAAVSMQIDTPSPGFRATIYAAPPGQVPKSVPGGWTKVGGGTVNAKAKRLKLDTGDTPYRYYLVWITKLAEGADNAEISEIRLFQEVAA